ncbi:MULTISPECIES: hypothetical protein [Dictyoglomus]|uniref:Cellobiose phosphorylase n=1 Tax=Dictyoglomus turgidum (strain DSM 6724 / Z-1310) TaxID=515635 RepID=B8DYR3_DICTD|nr:MULTISPECIES: hypothetical protein [Dictyoglomus]ACK41445.1 conserved hypothetical protein [Dictyoglomus turgidum DSM 6724]HBU31833.1 hypothetical protein [Dictyoglomus sp.]
MNPKIKYEVDKKKDLTFNIYNYNYAFPFSSFLPGISGILGIPMWCFYVNRGQCITSFGFESKDGAILEFHPANKAYRLTPIYGFRTFIKIDNVFYEPFRESPENETFERENYMSITPYDLTIYEINKTLNISCKVNYFTLPNEPVGALIRIFTIKNHGENELNLEIIDGIPQFLPYGLTNEVMKNMSRTIEAWYRVDNLENNAPFYRLYTTFQDITEVKVIKEGHFYFALSEDEKLLPVIIDPDLIFYPSNDFSYPYKFAKGKFTLPKAVFYGNRTPSAFSYTIITLSPDEERSIISFAGKADSLERLNKIVKDYAHKEFVEKKAKENEILIKSIMDNAFVHSASKEFNSYVRQSFLDNLLRGGLPITLNYNSKKDVIYLFGRKHGDLERDYNFFTLEANYFSQGNANYRDINQNRRNDIYFNPDVEHFNIWYFINLIQLDGYNPLVIKGVKYLIKEDVLGELKNWVSEYIEKELKEILQKPFIPFDVIKVLEKYNYELKKGNLIDFISFLLTGSRKIEFAEHGEGYWIDHWFYNLDLIESYESIFPDKMEDLLLNQEIFTYYDNSEIVLPREERYVLTENGVRQYRSLRNDEEKVTLIRSRKIEPNKVRTKYGKGDIYYTSLLSKLIALATVKYSTLDPENIGIEMEAGRPGWNDALNGLPGLFGSSVNETFELKRLLLLIKSWIEKYKLYEREVRIPKELSELLNSLVEITKENLKGKISNFEFWDKSSNLREEYREKTKLGISGEEISIRLSEILNILDLFLEKLNKELERAFDKEKGLYHTYFYYDLVDYDIIEKNGKKVIKPKKFVRKDMPLFLEGQVHYLKTERDKNKKREIMERIKQSDLYDKKLKMYKVNAPLDSAPLEIGRIKAFLPGWLENESIFLHLEYKYLLEILKAEEFEKFYEEMKNCLIPFMNPETYRRSIFENVSFIVSSRNPDPNLHGAGFSARLSGSTAEFYHMLLVMAFGKNPFYLDENNNLCFKPTPSIPDFLFTIKDEFVNYYGCGKEEKIFIPKNSFVINFLKNTLIYFINPKRKNTFGENGAKIKKYILYSSNEEKEEINREILTSPYSYNLRSGVYEKLEIVLE